MHLFRLRYVELTARLCFVHLELDQDELIRVRKRGKYLFRVR